MKIDDLESTSKPDPNFSRSQIMLVKEELSIDEIQKYFIENNKSEIFIDFDVFCKWDFNKFMYFLRHLFFAIQPHSRKMEPIIVGSVPIKNASLVDEFAKIHISGTRYTYDSYCNWIQSQLELDYKKRKERKDIIKYLES